MITNLEKKLQFIELVDEMKSITRTITLRAWRKESDADHSYHLAMMVLTFVEDFTDLDVLKCLKMSLLHDLVEIFAGDTYIFDAKAIETKKEREKLSLKKLEEILWKSSFQDFREIFEEYEIHETREAQFVYQLDKLHPIIQIYITDGRDFFEYMAEKDLVLANKYSKIDDTFGFRAILDQYFDKLEKGNMFYNPNK